jgi:hypothetical protein
MEWVESTCRTVRCSKRATKVVAIHHDVSPRTVATVVTEVVEAKTAEVAAAVEAVTIVAVIGVRGANEVTSMTTVDHGRIVQAEITKAVQIVARGARPVVMMEAVDDLVRRVDASSSRKRSRRKLRHDVTGNYRNNAGSKRRAWEDGFNRSLGSRC